MSPNTDTPSLSPLEDYAANLPGANPLSDYAAGQQQRAPEPVRRFNAAADAVKDYFTNPQRFANSPHAATGDLGIHNYTRDAGDQFEEQLRRVAPEFQEQVPQARQKFEAQLFAAQQKAKLDYWRDQYANADETTMGTIRRLAIPGAARVTRIQFEKNAKAADAAIQSGTANEDAYRELAAYARLAQLSEDHPFKEAIFSLPSVVGEYAAGGKVLGALGKVTPGLGWLAPEAAAPTSLLGKGAVALGRGIGLTATVPGAAIEAAASKGSLTDLKNLGPALAHEVLQNSVFGSLSEVANLPGGSFTNRLQRIAAKTGIGIAEQQAIDVIGKAAGLQTRYGLMQDILEGKSGDALKNLGVQALTFSALSALHSGDPEALQKRTLEDLQTKLNDMAGRGVSADQAAANLAPAYEMPEKPTLAPENPTGGPPAPEPGTGLINPVQTGVPGIVSGAVEVPGKPPPLPDMTPEQLAAWAKYQGLSYGEAQKRQATAKTAAAPQAPETPTSPEVPPEAPQAAPKPAEAPEATPGPPVIHYPEYDPNHPLWAPKETPEQKTYRQLTTSKKFPDVGNTAKFREGGNAPFEAVSDVDGMGKLSKEEGDAVLRAKIDSLREAGLEPYHAGQDEFLTKADTREELQAKLEDARARLQAKTGADFSYGIAEGGKPADADAALREAKEAKKAESAPRTPEQTDSALDRLEAAQRSGRAVGLDQIYDEFDLSPRQRAIANAVILDQAGLPQLAELPALRKKDGSRYTVERIRQLSNEVAKKLHLPGSLHETFNVPEAGTRRAALKRGIGRVPFETAEGERSVRVGPGAQGLSRAQAEPLADKMEDVLGRLEAHQEQAEKEDNDAGGNLPADRRRQLDEEQAGLFEEYRQLAEEQDRLTTRGLPAERGQPSPLRRGQFGGTAPGTEGAEAAAASPAAPAEPGQAAGPAVELPHEAAPAEAAAAPGRPAGGDQLAALARETGIDRARLEEAHAAAQPTAEDIQAANQELRQADLAPLTPEDIATAHEQGVAEGARQAAAESGPAPAPGRAAPAAGRAAPAAGAAEPGTEFPFGANEPGAGEPGQRVAGTSAPRVEPRDPVADLAQHLVAEEAGTLNVSRLGEIIQQKKEQLQKAMRFIWSGVQRIASKMVPDTTRQDRESGEAVARWMASGTYAHQAAEHYADKVLGEGSTPEFDRLAGTTLMEMTARYAKAAFLRESQKASSEAAVARARNDPAAAKEAAQRATEMMRKAAEVVSFIGGDNSALATEADYQQALRNPKVREAIRRYSTEYALPIKEPMFRTTQGMDPDEDIDALTQIPDYPVRAFALRPDTTDTSSFAAGAGRGNLRNLRLRRNPSALARSFSADAYETDLRKIITQDLDRTAPLAAKAEAFRVLEANGVGRWGKPGKPQEGETEFPFANPPKGTQEAKPGQTSWYVKGDAAGEWREALNLDPVKGYQKGLAALNYLPTVASVASTVEPTTHGVNLIGGLFAPRAIRGLFKTVYQRLFDKPAYRENLVELARIGAEKPLGLETGSLVGLLAPEHLQKPLSKYDPTYWTGRLLDGLSNLMRSSLGHAYDSLAEDDHVPDTETGKRDFINGWVGQYEKKAQNGLIRWLRDTKIGPFATAASTMTARGVRMLAASPGTDATSWRSALIMRAEVFAKMAAVVGGTAAMNYALWGRADGDDKTPFLALKTGEKEGKTQYLDLSAITGLKRGMRAVPLLSYLVERERGVLPEAKTEEKVYDTVHSILHPALGPSVQLAHTAITGKDIMGRQVAAQTSKATTPRGIHKAVQMGKPLSGQSVENVKAALLNANPVLGSLLGAYTTRQTNLEERFWHLFGSLAPKETTPPKIKK